MTGMIASTPARWARLSAAAAGVRHRQPGPPGETRWLRGFQRARQCEKPLWPRNPEDRPDKPGSCDLSPRSPRQGSGSWQGHSRLLGNAFEGAWGEVVDGLHRNQNAAGPVGMFELSVASRSSHQRQAGLVQVLDHPTKPHIPDLAASPQQPHSRMMYNGTVKPSNARTELQQ